MHGKFVIHLSRVIHLNLVGVHDKGKCAILTDNRVFQVAKFLDMLSIRFGHIKLTNDSTLRQVFFGFQVGILCARSFVHVDDFDNATDRVTHTGRIFRIANVNRELVNVADSFVVKLAAILYGNHDSPLATDLLHINLEQAVSARGIRILEVCVQRILMTRSDIFVSN